MNKLEAYKLSLDSSKKKLNYIIEKIKQKANEGKCDYNLPKDTTTIIKIELQNLGYRLYQYRSYDSISWY